VEKKLAGMGLGVSWSLCGIGLIGRGVMMGVSSIGSTSIATPLLQLLIGVGMGPLSLAIAMSALALALGVVKATTVLHRASQRNLDDIRKAEHPSWTKMFPPLGTMVIMALFGTAVRMFAPLDVRSIILTGIGIGLFITGIKTLKQAQHLQQSAS